MGRETDNTDDSEEAQEISELSAEKPFGGLLREVWLDLN